MTLEKCDVRPTYVIQLVKFGGQTVTEHAKDESKHE